MFSFCCRKFSFMVKEYRSLGAIKFVIAYKVNSLTIVGDSRNV